MGRGGVRAGSGTKPTWKNGKTKTIRVPIALADEILKIARTLDENETMEYNPNKVINLAGISVSQLNGKKFVFLQDLIKFGYLIEPLGLARVVTEEMYKSQVTSKPKQGGFRKIDS